MNDDYLWDRTGDPDPEIQQLEEVLGTLRYKPQPLELPAQVRIGRPRTFPRMAIAAAVAMMLVGVAAWLTLRRESAPDLKSTSNQRSAEQLKPTPEQVATPAIDDVIARSPKNDPKRLAIRKHEPSRKQVRPAPELTAGQRAEAEVAKDQLLLALRVASAKLSLAQKKAQGGYPGNLIRNQHKVG